LLAVSRRGDFEPTRTEYRSVQNRFLKSPFVTARIVESGDQSMSRTPLRDARRLGTRNIVVALPVEYPTPAEPGEAVVPADWWTLYSDATLNDLVASARKANADVRLAAARVQEAEGVLREARASLFPDVSAGYNYSRSRVSTTSVPPPPPAPSSVEHQLRWPRPASG
jgi:hypothetical protein